MQSIPLRKILTLICPAFSSVCLVIGYMRSGLAVAASVGLLVLLAWLAARCWPAAWAAGLALVFSLAASVFGITTSGTPAWLITGAALGLASWDLLLLNASLAGILSSPQTGRLELLHYWSLALALAAGLMLSLGGRLIHFRIPFLLILVLAVLAYFSLDRLLRVMEREFHR